MISNSLLKLQENGEVQWIFEEISIKSWLINSSSLI